MQEVRLTPAVLSQEGNHGQQLANQLVAGARPEFRSHWSEAASVRRDYYSGMAFGDAGESIGCERRATCGFFDSSRWLDRIKSSISREVREQRFGSVSKRCGKRVSKRFM